MRADVEAETLEDSYAAGFRAALPLVVPTLLIGASFGVAATSIGWTAVAPVVMSAIVFSGAAQFAVIAVLGAGGSVLAAIVAATLITTRFLAIGLAIGPFTRGGAVQRALEGQTVVDSSLILAKVSPTRYGARRLLGSTAPQYFGWVTGTLVGVLAGERIADPEALGLDVVFPAFFVALLAGELSGRGQYVTAAAAAVITLVLVPVAPPGIPVIAACAAIAAGRLVERRAA